MPAIAAREKFCWLTGMAARPAPKSPTPQRDSLRILIAVLLIVGATVIAYGNSFPGIFVFDDASSVLENASLRRLWTWSVFLPASEAGVAGRPLANLTLALNHAISGLDPWSYHAFNLTLHLGAVLSLFSVLRHTLRRPSLGAARDDAAIPLSAGVALLWALHPLATGVVNYVSQRTELLMALFCLLTLHGFIRGVDAGSRRWLAASVFACALGMLSKEVMIIAPLVVLLYDRTFIAGTLREALRRRGDYYAALASTWLVIGASMLTSRLTERGVGFDLGVTWRDYALTQGRAILTYLKLAVWPSPLVFDYGGSFEHHTIAAMTAALACVPLLVAALVAMRRRSPIGFAGSVLFLILAPTSSVIPIVQQPMAENRAYLPLAVIIATWVPSLYLILHRRAVLPGLAATCALAVLTVQRNSAYRTEVTLWADTVAKRPDSARAYGNLSAALLRAGRPTDAVSAAEAALRLLPDYPDARQNLALALARRGRLDEAIAAYETALRIRPDSTAIRYNFGEVLFQAGRPADAIGQFEAVLKQNPRHARAHNNLSVVLLSIDRASEAAGHARAALQLDPDFAEAHYNLGNALARLGDRAAAIASYEAALRVQPTFVRAHNNLGALLLQAGEIPSAITHFEAAVRLDPSYAPARKNLEHVRDLKSGK